MTLLALVGVLELTVAVLTGWGMVYIVRTPREERRKSMPDPRRWRQGHIEMLMQGTVLVALGAAIPDPPLIPTVIVAVFAWVAPLSFFPVALRPDIGRHPLYTALDNLVFVGLTAGWVWLAVELVVRYASVGR